MDVHILDTRTSFGSSVHNWMLLRPLLKALIISSGKCATRNQHRSAKPWQADVVRVNGNISEQHKKNGYAFAQIDDYFENRGRI
jgi:hypothetical protein